MDLFGKMAFEHTKTYIAYRQFPEGIDTSDLLFQGPQVQLLIQKILLQFEAIYHKPHACYGNQIFLEICYQAS